MKKSLVIISFAFIFLLSLSIVSAGLFGRSTGNQVKAAVSSEKLEEGETISSGNVEVTITDINKDTGIVEGILTNNLGEETPFSLAEGQETNVDGIVINAGNINPGFLGLFGSPIVPISITPPTSLFSPTNGGDSNGDVNGGSSCEVLELEELSIEPGNVGKEVLNNRFIDFGNNEVLTIDELFSTQLEEGNFYYIPIPNQECYWEASYEKGELLMMTVCLPPA